MQILNIQNNVVFMRVCSILSSGGLFDHSPGHHLLTKKQQSSVIKFIAMLKITCLQSSQFAFIDRSAPTEPASPTDVQHISVC